MTKEEIQNRIEKVAYDGATDGCNQAVIEREAEKLATELVKLFALPCVMVSVCPKCNSNEIAHFDDYSFCRICGTRIGQTEL